MLRSILDTHPREYPSYAFRKKLLSQLWTNKIEVEQLQAVIKYRPVEKDNWVGETHQTVRENRDTADFVYHATLHRNPVQVSSFWWHIWPTFPLNFLCGFFFQIKQSIHKKFPNRLFHGSNQSSGRQWQDGPENSYSIHKIINTKEERLALLAASRYSWAGAEGRSSASYQTTEMLMFLCWSRWGDVCKWVGSELTAS